MSKLKRLLIELNDADPLEVGIWPKLLEEVKRNLQRSNLSKLALIIEKGALDVQGSATFALYEEDLKRQEEEKTKSFVTPQNCPWYWGGQSHRNSLVIHLIPKGPRAQTLCTVGTNRNIQVRINIQGVVQGTVRFLPVRKCKWCEQRLQKEADSQVLTRLAEEAKEPLPDIPDISGPELYESLWG